MARLSEPVSGPEGFLAISSDHRQKVNPKRLLNLLPKVRGVHEVVVLDGLGDLYATEPFEQLVPGLAITEAKTGNQRLRRGHIKILDLYYLTTGNMLMAVGVRRGERSLQAETPQELFNAPFPSNSGENPFPYDVTADGQRFLIEEAAGIEVSVPLTAVLNWQVRLGK